MSEARNACTGQCCESFSLGSGVGHPEELDHIYDVVRRRDKQAEMILAMLVPLGCFTENPLPLKECTRAFNPREPVERLDVDGMRGKRYGAWFFTCRHYDKDAKSCLVYEDRPGMCRSFPNRGLCVFEGCDMTLPRELREGKFAGVYTSDCWGRDEEQLARALGVTEDEIQSWTKATMVVDDHDLKRSTLEETS